jgi:2'-5' RNA ligase
MNWQLFLEKREREFSSTQLLLPKDISEKIIQWGKEEIEDEEIYSKEGFGREDEIHTTVLFGLHDDTPTRVKQIVEGSGAIKITLGKVSLFKNDEYDVVKLDVESPTLKLLNKRLSRLPYTNTHKEYNPHVTIAYVLPGHGLKFEGRDDFEGTELTLTDFEFSSKSREKTKIKLK